MHTYRRGRRLLSEIEILEDPQARTRFGQVH